MRGASATDCGHSEWSSWGENEERDVAGKSRSSDNLSALPDGQRGAESKLTFGSSVEQVSPAVEPQNRGPLTLEE